MSTITETQGMASRVSMSTSGLKGHMGFTSKTPPNTADCAADRGPVLSCRKPPVKKPAAIEFQGSSCTYGSNLDKPSRHRLRWLQLRIKYAPRLAFRLIATSVQSKVENSPPHTAKLPPIFGASRLMACSEVFSLRDLLQLE